MNSNRYEQYYDYAISVLLTFLPRCIIDRVYNSRGTPKVKAQYRVSLAAGKSGGYVKEKLPELVVSCCDNLIA